MIDATYSLTNIYSIEYKYYEKTNCLFDISLGVICMFQ
jgi:hypothetical protein